MGVAGSRSSRTMRLEASWISSGGKAGKLAGPRQALSPNATNPKPGVHVRHAIPADDSIWVRCS